MWESNRYWEFFYYEWENSNQNSPQLEDSPTQKTLYKDREPCHWKTQQRVELILSASPYPTDFIQSTTEKPEWLLLVLSFSPQWLCFWPLSHSVKVRWRRIKDILLKYVWHQTNIYLLLMTITNSLVLFLSPGMRMGPTKCCFLFSYRPLPVKQLSEYSLTSQQCPQEAVM